MLTNTICSGKIQITKREVVLLIQQFMVLLIPLVIAVYYDIRRGIVPNKLILTGACVGLAIRYTQEGCLGAVRALAGAGLILVVLFVLFLTRAMGAGDIKLYSLIAIYMGIERSLWVFVISIMIAGLSIIFSTIIHFNSFNVVQSLATTVSNFILLGSFKRAYYAKENEVSMGKIKMTPYIALAVIIVALL